MITLRNIGTEEIGLDEIQVIDMDSGNDITKNTSFIKAGILSSKKLELNFDENSGIIAEDNSVEANDGTLGTGACLPGTSPCPSWDTGVKGSDLYFDGNDYVRVLDDSSLDISGDFAVSYWENLHSPPVSPTTTVIIGKYEQYMFGRTSTGFLGYLYKSDCTFANANQMLFYPSGATYDT